MWSSSASFQTEKLGSVDFMLVLTFGPAMLGWAADYQVQITSFWAAHSCYILYCVVLKCDHSWKIENGLCFIRFSLFANFKFRNLDYLPATSRIKYYITGKFHCHSVDAYQGVCKGSWLCLKVQRYFSLQECYITKRRKACSAFLTACSRMSCRGN